jgi:hypothetical protein
MDMDTALRFFRVVVIEEVRIQNGCNITGNCLYDFDK